MSSGGGAFEKLGSLGLGFEMISSCWLLHSLSILKRNPIPTAATRFDSIRELAGWLASWFVRGNITTTTTNDEE